jgi:hypothetical protein
VIQAHVPVDDGENMNDKSRRYVDLCAKEAAKLGWEYAGIVKTRKHARLIFRSGERSRFIVIPTSPGDGLGALNASKRLRRVLTS